MTPLSDDMLAALAAVDSPTVANVIELFEVQCQTEGFTDQSIEAVYPSLPPAVGYAVTATFRGDKPEDDEPAYGGMTEMLTNGMAIDAPRIAVFEDHNQPAIAATYGELMVSSYKKFGYAGLITSGAGRDVEQVRRLEFPCWTAGTIVSHGYPRVIAHNEPVTIGGLRIAPGDLIHADGNGIVVIPPEIAEGVAQLCRPFIEAEDGFLVDLEAMELDTDAYAAAIDAIKGRMARLKERAMSWKPS